MQTSTALVASGFGRPLAQARRITGRTLAGAALFISLVMAVGFGGHQIAEQHSLATADTTTQSSIGGPGLVNIGGPGLVSIGGPGLV